MFTESNLEDLQKNLSYSFYDISILKKELILYIFDNVSNNLSVLPFLEEAKGLSLKFTSSAEYLFSLNERKKGFFLYLKQAIMRFYSSQSDIGRLILLLDMNYGDSIFLILANKYNITGFGTFNEPNYSMLLINKVLYTFNAIFLDASKRNEFDLDQWIDSVVLKPYYKSQGIDLVRTEVVGSEKDESDPQQNHVDDHDVVPELEETGKPKEVSDGKLENDSILKTIDDQNLLSTFSDIESSEEMTEFEVSDGKFEDDSSLEPIDWPESFESRILKLKLDDMNSPMLLDKLIPKFDDSKKDREKYFKQFLPYIIEEVRAEISGQLNLIDNSRGIPPFNIAMTKERRSTYSDDVIECNFLSKSLPKLDHSFNMEVLLIQSKACEYLAIATIAYIDKQTQMTHLKLKILKDTVEQPTELFSPNTLWVARWVAGIISQARMYEVCTLMPCVKFSDQFISGNLEAWPDVKTPATENPLLNASQLNVINNFQQAESGLFFLQGPPGTGKTTTIINLLSQLLKSSVKKQRIMVCAPSNKAVRLLARRAREFPVDAEIVLTGISQDLSENLKDVFVGDYVDDRCQAINRLLNGLFGFNSGLEKCYKRFNPTILERFKSRLSELLVAIEQLMKGINKLTDKSEFALDLSAKSKVQNLIVKLSSLFLQFKSSYDAYQIQYEECFLKIKTRAFYRYTLSMSIKDKPLTFEETMKKLDTICQSIKQNMKTIIDETTICAESIEILMVQRADIIFSTLSSSGRKWIKKYIDSVDILIIDEATQAVEPEILIPFAFMPKKCLQVGDTKQLPATVISQHAQKNGFDKSMMFRLLEICEQPFQMLEIQYRMHPAICRWPSNKNYDGRLVTAPGLESRLSPLVDKKIDKLFLSPCLFINVQSTEDRNNPISKSIKNEAEAKVVIQVLIHLLKYLNGNQVGVITFYKEQVKLLKFEMEKTKSIDQRVKDDVMISTVDGFQGEEKDVILISSVRSSESVGFLRDIRRINVAVTRPRHHLFIFGNKESLENSNSDLADLIKDYGHSDGAKIIDQKQLQFSFSQ